VFAFAAVFSCFGATPARADVPSKASGAAEGQAPAETPGSVLITASEPDFELTAGTNGLVTFSSSSTQVSAFAEGRYRLSSYFQLGGSAAARYQSGNGTEASAFQGLFGPTLNLGADLRGAYFLSALVGVTTGQTMFGSVVINSSFELTAGVSLGKRFPLGERFAYAPSLGVTKELSFDPVFTIQPLSFSAFF
jgi:hypothetical protein